MLDQFLTLKDFQERIEGIPDNFDFTSLRPYWTQMVDSGIGDLLPPTHPIWTSKATTETAPLTLVRTAFKVYTIYAIWAAYINQGGFMVTESGPRNKYTDGSLPLDPSIRLALFRTYSDLASKNLKMLANLVRNDQACNIVDNGLTDPRVRVVLPKNKSPFR